MRRSDLLKCLLVAPAAVAAKKLDPDGEPLPESAPLIVMNAPGQTLQNMTIDASGSRRTAIQAKVDHQLLVDNRIMGGGK